MSFISNKPLGAVIRWQIIYAVLVSIGCGLWMGAHGAASGFLGAFVSVFSMAAYAVVISRHRGYSASGTLRTALRAEAVKIIVIIVALWGVFAVYEDVVPIIFIGSFIVAVIISSLAIFVPETPEGDKKVQK
ncbi:ATP synthase subunit I [Nitrosomonas halophila]|uniref:ATP synthase protein I n=1 Tax=Nitrosomonas halophila TaxID=44576 RepID=A0A1H3KST9_9PROT|nr:ATP synthase subunit I [Nitrosomonas halophila]SDY54828.1 ATP synthase protein I [Nitrosomonas halophila]